MTLKEDAAGSGAGVLARTVGALTGQHPARPARLTRGEPVVLRLIAPLALLVVAATIVCSGLGFVLAQQADDYLEAEHRQALRGAVEALQAVSPDLADVEPGVIRILERASGLKDLKFDAEPAADGREMQSLLDRNGRIVGWFSWQTERPATALLTQLLPFAVLIALGLLSFAGLAMWQLNRLGFLLAKTEQHAHRLEFEDPATGLPNTQLMFEVLDRALAARPADGTLALVVLDVEGLGEIKEAIGEAGGEEVVLEIAKRLRALSPPGAVIGRLRQERFALVMPSAGPAAARAVAEAAREAVARAIWVNQVVQATASLGFAVVPHDATTRDDLVRRAKLAARVGRRRGRGHVLGFTGEMETELDEKSFIRRELGRALAARDFDVHYQPIVKADGGAVTGVEALLRWNHSARGFIPPAVFVPVAEQAGLMDQLGEFVLRRALADAARWPDLYVGVNLSPVQVRDRKFVDLVAGILAETKFAPSRLILEITEGVLIDDPENAKARLESLRALGVQLALDDFGSGYSSLSYLQRLPFDKLKVDRSFVTALDQSANAGVIVQAIVSLGRALGMTVVIEGIETEEQRVLLRLAGCSEMQGYLFARPAPRERIDEIVAGSRTATSGPRPEVRAAV